MSGQQSSKRFRRRTSRKPPNFLIHQKLLRNPVNADELGPESIRRFVDDASFGLFDDLSASLDKLFKGQLATVGAADLGVSLLRRRELINIQKEPASRLGRYSTALALNICRGMLPDSAQQPASGELGRIVIARAVRNKCYVIAELNSSPTVVNERQHLIRQIDTYERAHNTWEANAPHITLGSVEPRNVHGHHFRTIEKTNQTFAGQSITLQLAE